VSLVAFRSIELPPVVCSITVELPAVNVPVDESQFPEAVIVEAKLDVTKQQRIHTAPLVGS